MSIWKTAPQLEHLNSFSQNCAVAHLGIEFTEVGEDFITAKMPVDARTKQPMGLLHGGVSVVLAETLGSSAAFCCINPTTHFVVGLDINANHLRGVREGWVYGTAKPIHIGQTTHVWEIRIVDDNQKLVCISRLTMAVVPHK